MAGKIKQTIDLIIKEKSMGDETIARLTRAKLIMMGINPHKYDIQSQDDPIIINKLFQAAKDFGLSIK